MALVFYLEADWTNAGFYATEQSTRLQAFTIRRGRNASVSGEGYKPVDAGELNATMKNHDGRFSLFNSGGSLYNYLRPNKPVRIRWYDTSLQGSPGALFTGLVSNIVNQPNRKVARIEALDGIEFLSKRKGDDVGLQTSYDVATAMYDILQASGYPVTDGTEWTFPITFPATLGGSAIENNGDKVPYFWGQTDKSAWEQLLDLASAFAGDAYIANDGTFSFAARGTRRASVVTLNDADVKAGAQPEQPWTEIRNYVRVAVNSLASNASVEMWRMYDVPYIAAGESLTVWAEFQYNGDFGPATSVTTPVATTDYLANALASGGGTNMTASLGVTFTAYTTRAKIVLQNNHATNGLYVTLLKVRGTILTSPLESAQIAEDATSQDNYEKRDLKINSPFMQEQSTALYHARHAKTVFADPRKVVWVQILNKPSLQLIPDLFDVVTLNLTELGATGDFRIVYIEHDYRPKSHATTWRLEPVIDAGWTFPAQFPMSLGW